MTEHDNSMLPFSAVVGQDDAKLALLLAAMTPRLGGVLLRGDKGSAKTTLARGLARLLPGHAPFVELPLGATEDRVLGSIDVAALLTDGDARFRPGLLAAAHGGVLYVDEINLLADHLVDALLDVAVSGVNRIEREGVSHTHPARFVLVASMNPEEGELRPQLLDRFGLAVDVTTPTDIAERALAVTKQLDADRDRSVLDPARRADATLAARLATVTSAHVPHDVVATACRVAVSVGAEGLRADLMLCRAAASCAGWEGRAAATEDDLRRVAPFVLAHRRRRTPFEEPGISDDELDDAFTPPEAGGLDLTNAPADPDEEQVVEPDAPTTAPDVATARTAHGAAGRSGIVSGTRGRYVRAVPASDSTSTIAAVPTAMSTAIRRATNDDAAANHRVDRRDLREAVHDQQTGRLVVLAVDTSGSMGVDRRIAAAKGFTFGVLTDAYRRRDRVAVVAFRGERAELVMRPTGSIEIARARLATLPTGGTTPLAGALDLALDVARGARRDGYEPLLVLVTDGRATSGGDDPLTAAREAAARVAAARVTGIVVDAEDGPAALGLAGELAAVMKAECVPLARFGSEASRSLLARH
jgi:magnesium chelatase subunit D